MAPPGVRNLLLLQGKVKVRGRFVFYQAHSVQNVVFKCKNEIGKHPAAFRRRCRLRDGDSGVPLGGRCARGAVT